MLLVSLMLWCQRLVSGMPQHPLEGSQTFIQHTGIKQWPYPTETSINHPLAAFIGANMSSAQRMKPAWSTAALPM